MTHIAATAARPDGSLESNDQFLNLPIAGGDEHPSRLFARLFQPAVPSDDLAGVLPRPEDHDFVIRRLGLVGGCDRLTTVERPDWNAFEGELRILCEPLGERLPIAGTNTVVVHHHVVVQESDGGGHVEIISHQPVQGGVCALTVSPIGLATPSFQGEADTFGVPLRALVELVDPELKPVEPEVRNEMALQLARRLIGHALTAVVRMDCQTLEVRDPRTAVLHLEAHHARASAVDLDHEATVRRGIVLRSFDLGRDRIVVESRSAAEEGLPVFAITELDGEAERVEPRSPPGDRHG